MDVRRARSRGCGVGRARRRSALLSGTRGAPRRMNELALALFAASHDLHAAARETRSDRFRAFEGVFDAAGYMRNLQAAGFHWLGRSDASFPRLLASIHDP